MPNIRSLRAGALVSLLSLSAASLAAQTYTVDARTFKTANASSDVKPTIILVHGAWADGTAWQHVIPPLEEDGYTVVAVQNQLSSLADDIATTKRAIHSQKGPVVVAAHSYGGEVMTGAAAGEANVKALVYIAAFAPDAGHSIGDESANFTATAIGTSVTPDAGGYLYINRDKFNAVFCQDVPPAEAAIMAVAQKPLNSTIFGDKIDVPAWKSVPSWYMVSMDDKTINPDQERFYAKRMHATTKEIHSSHVSLISHPTEVSSMIEDAARTTAK